MLFAKVRQAATSRCSCPKTYRRQRSLSSVALAEDELKRLLGCADEPTAWAKKRGVVSAQSWFAPAVWFAAFTGARRGETLAIRWRDLNLDDATAIPLPFADGDG